MCKKNKKIKRERKKNKEKNKKKKNVKFTDGLNLCKITNIQISVEFDAYKALGLINPKIMSTTAALDFEIN